MQRRFLKEKEVEPLMERALKIARGIVGRAGFLPTDPDRLPTKDARMATVTLAAAIFSRLIPDDSK